MSGSVLGCARSGLIGYDLCTSRIFDSFSSTSDLITLANGSSNDIITSNANTKPTPDQNELTLTLGAGKFATPVWAMLNLVKPLATIVQGTPVLIG